ncbi:MAG TPA: sugar phosphate isomerase/epimerase family protein [Burkholderiales bacterium]|nr:sugar phosphate isomerase/epimerase family protein [Burkholderiales bacterium]
MKFSVQTAVLPELSVRQVVEKLSAHGYDAVEWRIHDDYHIAPGELVSRASEIKRLVEDAGLAVSCLTGYAPLSDLAQQERFAEACAILHCPRYRPGAVLYDCKRNYRDLFRQTVDALASMIEVTSRYHVKPVIETHFQTIAPSASLAYRLVEQFDPSTIGINYDPANLIIEGREAWQMGLELLGPYLDYVHAKNVAWVRENGRWRWVFASMREGQVDWGEVIRALKRVDYDGVISFENFHLVPMTSTGFVGEDLTQHAESFRDIDERLDDDLRYLKSLVNERGS